jgi:mannose-6-phosphate isomerase-like protein (cupin superfamily)
MVRTTLLKHAADLKRGPLEKCHGGKGTLDFTVVCDGRECDGQHLRFLHDDVLPPGASIGVHQHTHEEHYYVLSGRGTMVLDGKSHPVGPGDVGSVYPGGSHGLVNNSPEPLRLIVIGL